MLAWAALAAALFVPAVLVHVAGPWVTSPPDVADALLFHSPTPFSAWGVVAMWAVFAAVQLAAFRRRLALFVWLLCQMALAMVVVVGTVVHAMLFDGTMGVASKAVLCVLVLAATVKRVLGLCLPAEISRLMGRGRRRGFDRTTRQDDTAGAWRAPQLPPRPPPQGRLSRAPRKASSSP